MVALGCCVVMIYRLIPMSPPVLGGLCCAAAPTRKGVAGAYAWMVRRRFGALCLEMPLCVVLLGVPCGFSGAVLFVSFWTLRVLVRRSLRFVHVQVITEVV